MARGFRLGGSGGSGGEVSEKTFYIYDQGNWNVQYSNGTGYTMWSGTTAKAWTLSNTYMYASSTSGTSQYPILGTSSKIDLTNYTTLHLRTNVVAQRVEAWVLSEKNFTGAYTIKYYTQGVTSGYVEMTVDVSDLAGDYYIAVAVTQGTGGANAYVDQIWLTGPDYNGRQIQALVPTMTSNTTPRGVVSASSIYSSDYPAWKAFDGSISTNHWNSAVGESNSYLAYAFIAPVVVTTIAYNMIAAAQGGSTTDVYVKFQASNDGQTWIDLTEQLTMKNSSGSISLPNNKTAYINYRLYLSSGSTGLCCRELQFYGYNPNPSDTILYEKGVWNVAYENPGSLTYSGVTITGATLTSDHIEIKPVNSAQGLIGLTNIDITNLDGIKIRYKCSASNQSAFGLGLTNDVSSAWTGIAMNVPAASDYTEVILNTSTATGSYNLFLVNTTSSAATAYIDLIELMPGGDINNVTKWLQAGGITDKPYTSLSQVLADTTTLAALMASTSAVDYLVTCTAWISYICANQDAMTDIGNNNYATNTLLGNTSWASGICSSAYIDNVLNVKVPTMTSNTAPSGQCIRSATAGTNYEAWKAFDGVANTYWGVNSSGVGSWVGYVFTSPALIKAVGVRTGVGTTTTSSYVSSFKVQGSNDQSTWVDLTDTISCTPAEAYKTQLINNMSAFSVYRIVVLSINSYASLSTLQFYGRTDII